MRRFFRIVRSNRFTKRFVRKFGRIAETARRNPGAVAALGVAAGAAVLGLPADLLAWSAPTTGSFAYDIYDIAVNKILNGPIGFVTGMGCMGAGGYFIANSRAGGMASGIPMILLGGALIKLDTITQSLGMMI